MNKRLTVQVGFLIAIDGRSETNGRFISWRWILHRSSGWRGELDVDDRFAIA